LIPLFVKSLIDKYRREESEDMIRNTLNYERCNGNAFWKEQLCNYIVLYEPDDLLDCFNIYGLNIILTKDDVKAQCLGTPDYYDKDVGFKNFEAVIMLVGRFGFDIMTYDGAIIVKSHAAWVYKHCPSLISDV
jgi:hypothetical protein